MLNFLHIEEDGDLMINNKAILLASFGSTNMSVMNNIMIPFEKYIKMNFEDYYVISGYINSKIKDNSLSSSLEILIDRGFKELIVQPTFMENGESYNKVKEEVLKYANHFNSIKFSNILINSKSDITEFFNFISSHFNHLNKNQGVVCVAHGIHMDNKSSAIYDNLMISNNIYIGYLKDLKRQNEIIKIAKESKLKEVFLFPLLNLPGYHLDNDINGEKNSWRSKFEEENIKVHCIKTGLLEYSEIREMYVNHIKILDSI